MKKSCGRIAAHGTFTKHCVIHFSNLFCYSLNNVAMLMVWKTHKKFAGYETKQANLKKEKVEKRINDYNH